MDDVRSGNLDLRVGNGTYRVPRVIDDCNHQIFLNLNRSIGVPDVNQLVNSKVEVLVALITKMRISVGEVRFPRVGSELSGTLSVET